jgi:hypothetical protein
MPDKIVTPRIADFVSGSDAVLEAAIRSLSVKSN